jgi:hypothetical protein
MWCGLQPPGLGTFTPPRRQPSRSASRGTRAPPALSAVPDMAALHQPARPRAAPAGTRPPAQRPGPRGSTRAHPNTPNNPLSPRLTTRSPGAKMDEMRDPPTRPGRPGVADTCPGEGPDPACPRCYAATQAGPRGSTGATTAAVPEPTRPRLDAPSTACGSRPAEPQDPGGLIIRFAGITYFPEGDANLGLVMRTWNLGVPFNVLCSYGMHSQGRGKRAYGELPKRARKLRYSVWVALARS